MSAAKVTSSGVLASQVAPGSFGIVLGNGAFSGQVFFVTSAGFALLDDGNNAGLEAAKNDYTYDVAKVGDVVSKVI